jgi:hypothetical protein
MKEEEKQYPKTFEELFANTSIKPKTDENGNTNWNFKATMKEESKQECIENKTVCKEMYSEEDMTEYAIYIVFNNLITPKQWFEQFKKK